MRAQATSVPRGNCFVRGSVEGRGLRQRRRDLTSRPPTRDRWRVEGNCSCVETERERGIAHSPESERGRSDSILSCLLYREFSLAFLSWTLATRRGWCCGEGGHTCGEEEEVKGLGQQCICLSGSEVHRRWLFFPIMFLFGPTCQLAAQVKLRPVLHMQQDRDACAVYQSQVATALPPLSREPSMLACDQSWNETNILWTQSLDVH
jgi:hypothetical protein